MPATPSPPPFKNLSLIHIYVTLKAQDEDALGLSLSGGGWSAFFDGTPIPGPVSYTHLDVYKRQL